MFMLTTNTRLTLQAILERMARGEPVSLKDRVLLQKYADRDRTVMGWLHRAQRQRQRPDRKSTRLNSSHSSVSRMPSSA